MINVLITGAGSLLGQGIIKTLKKSNLKYNIYSTDYFKNSIGFYWSIDSYVMPDILKYKNKQKDWLDKIIKIVNYNKIDVIIPGLDFELNIFAKNKKIIEKKSKCKVLISTKSVIKTGLDKWLTYKFLKNNNFYCPESCLPRDLKIFLKKNKFPFIVKPRFGSTSKNVSFVKNNKELNIALDNCPNPIIQKKIGTNNNEYTVGIINYNKKIKSIIALKRKLKNGNTVEATHQKKYLNMYPYLKKIAIKLNPLGPINFQLKYINNKPYIFEINPRFSGTTPIRNIFGINEIDIIINLIINKKNTSSEVIKYGTVLKYYEDFFINKNDFKKIK